MGTTARGTWLRQEPPNRGARWPRVRDCTRLRGGPGSGLCFAAAPGRRLPCAGARANLGLASLSGGGVRAQTYAGPWAFLGFGDEYLGGQPDSLEPGALLDAPREDVMVLQGLFPACVPEIASLEEAYYEDTEPEFLTPWVDAAADSVAGFRPSARGVMGPNLHCCTREPSPQASLPSPLRRLPGPYINLDFHIPEPFPSSPLQPLPPSPSPGPPHATPAPSRSSAHTQRRLFQE